MKNKKKLIISFIIFLIVILYLSFLSIDLQIIQISNQTDHYTLSNFLKYLSIVLCFTLNLFIGKNKLNSFDKRYLQLGFLFTLLADTCLIVFDKYILGICFFCFVHFCYLIRYKQKVFTHSLGNLFLFFIFLMIFKIILNLVDIEFNFLFVIAIFYAACISTSTFNAISSRNNYPSPNNLFIVLGMILFMLCDINVALYNIPFNSNILGINLMSNLSSNLIWLFYLPSQLLISLSGFKYKKSS
jgi:hypothetical protein